MSQNTLDKETTEKTFNVLGLLQCIAMHKETKDKFLEANLPLYCYPLINNNIKDKGYIQVKLNSLGVIGALVKENEASAIKFIIGTELIVLCLR